MCKSLWPFISLHMVFVTKLLGKHMGCIHEVFNFLNVIGFPLSYLTVLYIYSLFNDTVNNKDYTL
jgi:hypothetical protein